MLFGGRSFVRGGRWREVNVLDAVSPVRSAPTGRSNYSGSASRGESAARRCSGLQTRYPQQRFGYEARNHNRSLRLNFIDRLLDPVFEWS